MIKQNVRFTQTETEGNQNLRPEQAKFARTTEAQAQTHFSEKLPTQTEESKQLLNKVHEEKRKSIKQMNRHEMGIQTEALDYPVHTGKGHQMTFVDISQE